MENEKKLRILVLDDDEERHNWFLFRFMECEVTIVDSAPAAIEKLKTETFDAIFLDHDLTWEHSAGINHDVGTGYEVAQFIAQYPRKFQKIFMVVHSMNYWGSCRMCEIVRKAGLTIQQIAFFQLQTSRIQITK